MSEQWRAYLPIIVTALLSIMGGGVVGSQVESTRTADVRLERDEAVAKRDLLAESFDALREDNALCRERVRSCWQRFSELRDRFDSRECPPCEDCVP